MKNFLFTLVLLISYFSSAVSQEMVLDDSFGQDGVITKDFGTESDVSNAIAIQNDGKIVIAGRVSTVEKNNFCLLRYLPDGTIDTSFGENGIVVTEFEFRGTVFDIVIQPDNRIIAVGNTWTDTNVFAITRYLPNGDLDPSFGDEGVVFTTIGEGAVARSVALYHDGKFVVAGLSRGIFGWEDYAFALARYNPDGSLDQSFGEDGIVRVDIIPGSGLSAIDEATSVLIQPDQKIVVGGYSGGALAITRHLSDGALDASFGVGGIVTLLPTEAEIAQCNSLQLQKDGFLLAAGFALQNGSNTGIIARYDTAGNLDYSFGENGIAAPPVAIGGSFINSIVLEESGQILAGGSYADEVSSFAISRYHSDGNLDEAFGDEGIVVSTLNSYFSAVTDLALQSDKKIVATGFAQEEGNDYIALARYSPQTVRTAEENAPIVQLAIAPNPTKDISIINTTLLESSHVSIALFDMSGKHIRDIINQHFLPSGKHQYVVDLATLPVGAYIVQLSTDLQTQSLKLVKQ